MQAWLAATGFYEDEISFPPRLIWAILPPVIFMSILLFSHWHNHLDYFSIFELSLLHAVRLPLGIIFWWLYEEEWVPEIMTIKGWNYDVIFGASAILITFVGPRLKKIPRKVMLAWNLLGLAIWLNFAVIEILSLPSPIQAFGFEQPNVADVFFPYVWFPTYFVPIIIIAHFAAIRILLKPVPQRVAEAEREYEYDYYDDEGDTQDESLNENPTSSDDHEGEEKPQL